MKAIAYIRCSTDRQDVSPDAQRKAIEAWAELERAEVADWHEDLACPVALSSRGGPA